MALLWLGTTQAMAQKDSLAVESLSLEDSITIDSASLSKALAPKALRKKRNWATWRPDTKRAMWLALVLPGAGQIYNRKYWKLPIIYGGFVGCAYAMSWNNQMYHDYSQAYLDIMDDDPNTQSYNQFLHLGAQIDASNIERYKEIFRKRKDRYRQNNLRHFFAWEGSLDSLGYLLGENLKLSQVFVFHIEDVINLLTGNHQSMTFADRANVEESIELVAF